MASASADAVAQPASAKRLGRRSWRAKKYNDSAARKMNAGYERASCPYQKSSGLAATRAAAMSAARFEKSSRVATNATTMVAVPKTADSDRRPTSPLPKRSAQAQASV